MITSDLSYFLDFLVKDTKSSIVYCISGCSGTELCVNIICFFLISEKDIHLGHFRSRF